MKALLQRVKRASVTIDGSLHAEIGQGLLVFLGIGQTDSEKEIDFLVRKILQLRIFNDDNHKMNRSLFDVGGEALIVSQFTLFAECKKGNRPAYTSAAPPALAKNLYEKFIERFNIFFKSAAKTGVFAADMKIDLLNDGPVTIMLDTEELLSK